MSTLQVQESDLQVLRSAAPGSTLRVKHCSSKASLLLTRRSDRITGYCFKCSPAGDEDGRPLWFCEMLRGKEIIAGMNAEPANKWFELPEDIQPITLNMEWDERPDVKWLIWSGLNSEILSEFNAMYSPSTGGVYFNLHPAGPSRGWIVRKPNGSWFVSRGSGSSAIWRAAHHYSSPLDDLSTAFVIVEDIASAIKLTMCGYDGVAILGTKLNTDIKSDLARLVDGGHAIVWLDQDKHGSGDENKLCRYLGMFCDEVTKIWKPEPKLLGYSTIRAILR